MLQIWTKTEQMMGLLHELSSMLPEWKRKDTKGCSEEQMKEFLQVVQKYVPGVQLRGM